jgi:hypothetical protein
VPLGICAGPSHALVTAWLRPGKRPLGAENALIVVRRLAYLRRHWPQPHILGRGDRPCATPEILEGLAHRHPIDFVFGLAGNAVLLRPAVSGMPEARGLPQQRPARAQAHGARPPASRRRYEECAAAAASWSQPWRVIGTAAVMAAGDHPRGVGTSLAAPTPQQGYAELYCARGTCDTDIKAVQCALHRDRTAATTFLANATRLLLAWAASVLPHALRTPTLAHTALATAPPSTVLLTLFTGATQGKQDTDRMLRPLPTSCPVKALCHRGTTGLPAIPVSALHPS